VAFLREICPSRVKSQRAGIYFTAGVLIFQEATGTITVQTPLVVRAFAEASGMVSTWR
jgi:hypothetical protein